MEVKRLRAPLTIKQASAEGDVIAAFSVFNVRDDEGDVVLPSFFTDGQAIPMAGWGHNWSDLPPGKGTIKVFPDRAEFHGRFFLETVAGREHYATVKAMGDLQEWSFGFRILESERGTLDDQPVRFLTAGETYEASPVLVGANRETYTVAIKGEKAAGTSRAADSYEALIDALNSAVMDAYGADDYEQWAYVVATYPKHAIICQHAEGDRRYYEVQYRVTSDVVVLGDAALVERAFVPMEEEISLAGQLLRARHAAELALKRTEALAALRRKEGRALGTERRAQLEALAGVLGGTAGQLAALCAEPEPASTEQKTEQRSGPPSKGELLAIAARLNGVPV